MAERQIEVEFVSTYRGDLTKQLRKDQRRLEAMQRWLRTHPLHVPLKFDMAGAKAQAGQLRDMVLGEFAKKTPSGILGADGRPAANNSALRDLNKAKGLLSETASMTFDKDGKIIGEALSQVEQLGNGLQRVSKFKKDMDDGNFKLVSSAEKDVRTVKALEDGLRGVNKELGREFAAAKGRGDKAGQLEALQKQKAAVDALMTEAAKGGLTGSGAYSKAEGSQDRLAARIAGMEGSMVSADEKKARADRTAAIASQIKQEEARAVSALKANKLEADQAERIPDRAKREAEMNRIFDERKKIFEGSRDAFRKLDADLQREGRPDLAQRAMNRGIGANSQVDQAVLDQSRFNTDSMRQAAAEQAKAQKEAQKKADQARRLAEQAAKRSGTRGFNRALRLDDAATKRALRVNESQEAAAKAIPDRARREAELNRVLAERAKIYEDSERRLASLQQTQGRAGNVENAMKAESAALKARDSAQKVGVDQAKADAASQNAARKKADEDARKLRDSNFNRELQDIKANGEKRLAAINQEERRALAGARNASDRSAAVRRGHHDRQREMGNMAGAYSGVESRARAAGAGGIADSARGRRLGAEVAAAKDMEKFATATRKSGHALDFHSSSLLKNMVTVARWGAAVAVVQRLTSAFRAGVAGAIAVDRQFATLRAVFRGTDEEAQKLKVSTLDLASAQGRTASEAMDASIRWSRLGLNRVQVLQATKVSLMAANVAEMSAAETSEKLSAIYATYRMNVGDLPLVLSRLNAISNRYNVTNKDLLEGIVRVAGVAKQAGMELRDLEGIIGAVTGATGRPGQEVGNALKFVVTRLAAPETMKALKKNFDIDLTEPNGDLKDMSQIFRELASIYPTLNKSQQALFLKLTAGSRQASRMALIMDQYVQAQILAAEASFDTASAFEENQKILESLQSRIDSLKASWISLFTTMGDAGVFELVIRQLRGIESALNGVRLAADKKQNGLLAINDPGMGELVENIGGGRDDLGTRSKFDKGEVLRSILAIQEAIKEREKLIKDNADSLGNVPLAERIGKGLGLFASNGEKISETNLRVSNPKDEMKWESFENLERAKQALEALLTLEAGGGDAGAADEIELMTNEVNRLRDRLSGLERASGVFEMIGASVKDGQFDRQTMIRNFEGAAHLLLAMENGATLYGNSIDRFYKLLDAGDNAGLRELMAELGEIFSGDIGTTTQGLEEKMAPVVASLRAKLVEVEKERRAAVAAVSDGTAQGERDRESNIEKLQGDAKALQASIEQLTQAAEAFNKAAFNIKETSNINRYLDDLVAQAAAWGEAYEEFAPDAEGDPVTRIFNRKRRKLTSSRDALAEVQNVTNAVSSDRRASAESRIKNLRAVRPMVGGDAKVKGIDDEIAAQQKIIDQQNEADQMAKTRLDAANDELEPLLRKLDVMQQIANLQRIQTDAQKLAANSSLAWRFGETDSDKDANQAAAAIERAKIGMAGLEYGVTGGDPVSSAAVAGQVLQDEATARERLSEMVKRNFEIDAARRQVAYDTTKAMKEQTDEASKRFQLASREDQLRAAALKRTIDTKGKIGMNEFAMLSQPTRQAVVNYLPNDAPGNLNEAKAAAARTYRELNEEQGKLKVSIGTVSTELADLGVRISRALKTGGPLDVIPKAPEDPIQTAAGRDQNPVINLDIGSINMQIKLGEQLNGMLSTYVDQRLKTEVAAMETRLRQQPIPNAQGSVE